MRASVEAELSQARWERRVPMANARVLVVLLGAFAALVMYQSTMRGTSEPPRAPLKALPFQTRP